MQQSDTYSTGITTKNPRTYFNYPACRTCITCPCKKLCFGLIIPGKFILVHSRDIGKPGCPFASSNPAEIDELLLETSLHELTHNINGIIAELTSSERIEAELGHHVSRYDDRNGRIAYIKHLCELGKITFVRIPLNYHLDPRLRKWFSIGEGDIADV